MSRTTVEEIKARIPIEELIASYVKVEKSGRSLKARCPFHNEKTASFFISPERGGYYCFGCGAKGDIFSFVEQFEGLDFKGALKVLAERAGVPLVMDQKTDSDNDKLFKITEEACKYFEDQFKKSKEAEAYVNRRGVSPETRGNFRIGWAPEGWQNLLNYLKTKGWNESVIEKAGFIKKRDGGTIAVAAGGAISPTVASLSSNTKGKLAQPKGDGASYSSSNYYDRFRGRVMFPITDSSGRVVAFTGRILKEDDKNAKYLNSPETPIFTKSQILFGLDKAKTEIRRVGYSILVEGQMDLVLSHQVGVKNAIAASGTALTDQSQGESGVISNLGMVRRLSSNMIIALDSDKAGRTAAMRAVAATALSMGMSVKIADIEGGKDPADLILDNPENWKNVLKNSKHVIEFELGNVLKEVPDSQKLGKAVRERVFPFLARIDSEMDKAYFVKIIAEKSGLNEQSVWEDLRKFEKTMKQTSASSTNQSSVSNNLASSAVQRPLSSAKTNNISTNADKNSAHRLDLVERRMFGLLNLMETSGIADAKEYRERIKKIAGDIYEDKINKITPMMGDLSFEAEAFYGNEKDRFNIHMNELIFNFEEDLINKELIETMGKLRSAEKAGDNKTVSELAKKCQVLSMRKAEVGKQRRV
ncbi:MAG: CHC2 zinc finger domain-containing protein [Candidatus Paceibacterota bacterium]|jgi:DNA primase